MKKKLDNAKVSVIGAAGFIGSFLVKEFLKESVKKIIGLLYMNVYGLGQDQQAAYSGVASAVINKIHKNEAPIDNVDTEVQITIKKLCNVMLKLKNSNLKINLIPYSTDDTIQLVQSRIGSRQKAKQGIGFKYKHSLEDGLKALKALIA